MHICNFVNLNYINANFSVMVMVKLENIICTKLVVMESLFIA